MKIKFLATSCIIFILPIYAYGLSVQINDWTIKRFYSNPNELGVVVSNNSKNYFYKLDKKLNKIIPLSEESFTSTFSQEKRDDSVNYTLNNCKGVDEIYLSYDSICDSASFDVNGKKHLFTKDGHANQFFKWEIFIDPIIFNNSLIFKNYVKANKSGDTGLTYKAKVDGVAAFDLNLNRRIPIQINKYFKHPLETFKSSSVSSIYSDTHSSILWIGNEFGFYGFNEKFVEVLSCVFKVENNILKEILCSEPDYIHDLKNYQARLLLNKNESQKKGLKAPDDLTARMNYRSECLEKISPKIVSAYAKMKKRIKIIIRILKKWPSVRNVIVRKDGF